MNADQLRKNVGQLVRLRPIAQRFHHITGERLDDIDDEWLIRDVGNGAATLYLSRTGHIIDIPNDSLREYRATGHLLLRAHVKIQAERAWLDPIWGAGADPKAIALADEVEGLAQQLFKRTTEWWTLCRDMHGAAAAPRVEAARLTDAIIAKLEMTVGRSEAGYFNRPRSNEPSNRNLEHCPDGRLINESFHRVERLDDISLRLRSGSLVLRASEEPGK